MAKSQFFKNRVGRILPAALISVFIPFLMFISIPFEVFCQNVEEFIFGVSAFLPLNALLAVVCAVCIFAVLFLIPEKVYPYFYGLAVAGGLLLFLQEMYLSGDYNSLSGDALSERAVDKGQLFLNLAIWVSVLIVAVALVILRKKLKFLKSAATILCVALIGSQIISVAVLAVSTDFDKAGGTSVLTDEGLDTVAGKDNVYIFCIDRFDRYFADVMLENNDEVLSNLDGFTYFNDVTAKFGRTYPSVAYMLSMDEYKYFSSRSEYLANAYSGEDAPLSVLAENGYKINVFAETYYTYENARAFPSYVNNRGDGAVSVNDPLRLSLRMSQFSLFRCAPIALKEKASSGLDSGTCNYYVDCKSDEGIMYTTDADFPSAEDIKTDGEKQFTYIHLYGFHGLTFNREHAYKYADSTQRIMKQGKENLDVVNEYIKAMKANGTYKNATIIITGDHASCVSDSRPLDGGRTTVMFIKRAGEEGTPLKTSKAQLEHADMWPTIFKSVGITPKKDFGKSAYDYSETENRERYYNWTYMIDDGGIYEKYKVTGPSDNFDNWEVIETEKGPFF